VNPELFHAGLPRSKCLSYAEAYWSENGMAPSAQGCDSHANFCVDIVDKRIFKRNSDCLTAFLLGMKRRPVVRFSKQFEITKRLAYEISVRHISSTVLFDSVFTFLFAAICPAKNEGRGRAVSLWSFSA